MTDTDKNLLHPLSDAESLDTLREMARDMQVALYRRYDTGEAVKILNVSETELEALRVRGEIAYLLIGQDHVAFFGCQLLTYLLHCVVPLGATPEPREPLRPEPIKPKPVVSPEAELVSVDDAIALLSIGKTKFYDLMKTKQINRVRIGRRTLIKRKELEAFVEQQLV